MGGTQNQGSAQARKTYSTSPERTETQRVAQIRGYIGEMIGRARERDDHATGDRMAAALADFNSALCSQRL